MTTATKETRKRTVEVEVPTVFLEMDMEEAQALLALSHRVGGSPKNSGRKHIDSIRKALTEAGVERGDNSFMVPGQPYGHATIHFRDYQ